MSNKHRLEINLFYYSAIVRVPLKKDPKLATTPTEVKNTTVISTR